MDGYDNQLDAERNMSFRGDIFMFLFIVFGIGAAILLL